MAKVIGFETLAPDATTAVGPTTATLQGAVLFTGDASVTPARKMGANYAFFGPVETQSVRWRDDGTAPTTTVGHLVPTTSSLEYDGDLSKIKFIATTGTASIPVSYYNTPKNK